MLRAREPDEDGFIERDGIRIHWESFGDGRRRCCCCRRGRSCTRGTWKVPDPVPRPALPGRHLRRPRQRPLRPPAGRRRPTTEAEFVADALAVLDATGTERAVVVGLSMGAQRALLLAADHPERVARRVFVGARPAARRPRRATRRSHDFDEELRHRRGLGEVQPPLLAARLPRLRRVLLRRSCFTEPHSTKQIEDAVGWALETDAGDADRGTRSATGSPTRPRCASSARARALPGARRARRPGRRSRRTPTAPALAEATGGALVTLRGLRPRARTLRDPVPVNLLLRDFVGAASRRPRRAGRGPRAAPTGALPLVADRPRPRAARPRDRRRAAQLHPDLEIDWLAQHPVTRVLEARGRAHPPRQRGARQRVARTSSPSRASTTCTCFQAIRRMDEILRRQLHGLPRPRRATSATTCGSATRPGSSTTSCTRTRS